MKERLITLNMTLSAFHQRFNNRLLVLEQGGCSPGDLPFKIHSSIWML
jgi:hypothetical protein